MIQSRLGSLVESCSNTFIGWGVGLLGQLLLFPLFHMQVNFSTNLKLSFFFTLISVIRSYFVRRLFNARLRRKYVYDETYS